MYTVFLEIQFEQNKNMKNVLNRMFFPASVYCKWEPGGIGRKNREKNYFTIRFRL